MTSYQQIKCSCKQPASPFCIDKSCKKCCNNKLCKRHPNNNKIKSEEYSTPKERNDHYTSDEIRRIYEDRDESNEEIISFIKNLRETLLPENIIKYIIFP